MYKGRFSYKNFANSEFPGRKVAIKILGASDYESWIYHQGDVTEAVQLTKKMVREAKHMLDLIQHPNIVQYIHSCQVDKDLGLFYIFMELCSEETLADRVSEKHYKFNDMAYCKAIILHLSLAVQFMHKQGIYHRDIKPSNILFTEDGQMVKISDFGFSKKIKLWQGMISSTNSKGTDGYRPPESYDASRKGKVSDRSDVFSLGLVYFYILTKGNHPFGLEVVHQQSNICNEDKQPDIEGLKGVDAALAKDLIGKMITKTESDRPDMDEVMKHPYFWNVQKVIAFYIKVHDCLVDELPLKTDQSNMALQDQIKDFFSATKAAARVIGNKKKSESRTQRIVAEKLLSNGFCDSWHKDAQTYIKMVQDILDETEITTLRESYQLQVERFFIMAYSAAQAAVIPAERSSAEERSKRLTEDQRIREKNMLSESYFGKLCTSAQSYIATIHEVLVRLDRLASGDSKSESDDSVDSPSEEDEVSSDYENDWDSPIISRSVSTDSEKTKFFEEDLLHKSHEKKYFEESTVSEVVNRILHENGKDAGNGCKTLGNLSSVPLTTSYLISIINECDETMDLLPPDKNGNETRNDETNERRSNCSFSRDFPLRTDFISAADVKRLKEAEDSVVNESLKRNRDSMVSKVMEFISLYQRINERGRQGKIHENTTESNGGSILLQRLNRLNIIREAIPNSTDWNELAVLVEELQKGPNKPKEELLEKLSAKVVKLSRSGINGSERSWKECFSALREHHEDKCDNCPCVELANRCIERAGNDIFGLVAFIRHRLVHFGDENAKPNGIRLSAQEDILTFVASAVPELLMHMVKVMKEKNEIQKFIEDNKQVNTSYLLPLVRREDHVKTHGEYKIIKYVFLFWDPYNSVIV